MVEFLTLKGADVNVKDNVSACICNISYIPYGGFFIRHYFHLVGLYFDAIDSAQKYVPIKNE